MIFLDFEATGLGPDSYPIEIALVKADAQYTDLILPKPDWEGYGAEHIHCIPEYLIHAHGVDVECIKQRIDEFVDGPIWVDSITMDPFWFKKLYGPNSFEFRDITLLDGYRRNPHPTHKALDDARYNFQEYNRLRPVFLCPNPNT